MQKKKIRLISIILPAAIILILTIPSYIRVALVHWYPDITDTNLFHSHKVAKADSVWEWERATNYNAHTMCSADSAYLAKFGTVSFLVIQNDSILYEEYREGWTPETLSNIFSATKSIVGLLVGIAHEEGYIKNLDDKVGQYLPEFREGNKAKITIKDLLTMSSGLDWDEAYTSLFSPTTQAYYGDNIRNLVMNLEATDPPGKTFAYKSGDTQILSFVIEAATKRTISDYAQQKLWQPMQASTDALWNLDKENGDEKSYCCFNTTARDIARFARLIMHHGNWNGKQLISEEYIRQATTPARHLRNEFNDAPLDYYGYQIWITNYRGMQLPYFRGLGGQYIFAIPEKNAIIVRLGHKKNDIPDREKTIDVTDYLNIAFKILK